MNPLDIIICIFDRIIKIVSHKQNNYIHCRDRRKSPLYLKKREIVKNIWTGTLVIFLIILQFNHTFLLALIVVVAFFITFISFVVLDETE